LVALCATAEQQDHAIFSPAKVDAVAWTMVDAQLVEATTKGIGIPEVAQP